MLLRTKPSLVLIARNPDALLDQIDIPQLRQLPFPRLALATAGAVYVGRSIASCPASEFHVLLP